MTSPATVAVRDADGRFTTVTTEEHFRGAIISVRVDTVTMPGGGVARREIVEHLPAVAVVALDEDGRVVLIEQYRHPLRRRLWEIPAGLLDEEGEPPLHCAQRELREETGLAAEDWSVLVDLASSPGYSTEAIRVYLARGLTATAAPPTVDEEADLRVVRVPLTEAVDAVFRGAIANASAVAGLLAAAQVTGVGAAASSVGAAAPADGGHGGPRLRPGDDPWADSPALVNEDGPIGPAAELAAPKPPAEEPGRPIGWVPPLPDRR